jgi:hypothetical protein
MQAETQLPTLHFKQHPAPPRSPRCQILLILRLSITLCYAYTFLFNILFRMILILFADRGLVAEGRPNLQLFHQVATVCTAHLLFHQLYWVIFCAFFTQSIINFPILPIIRGTFSGTILGKV